MKNPSANFLILVMRFLLLHCCASFAMTVLGSSDFFKLGTVLLICMLLFYFWGTKIKNGIIFIFIHMLVLTAFSLPFEGILRGAVIPVMYVCDYKAGGEIIQYSQIVLSIIIAIIFILLSVFTPLIGEADGIIIGYVGCVYSSFYSVDIIYYAGSFRLYMGSC